MMTNTTLSMVSRKRLSGFYIVIGFQFLFQLAISSLAVPYLPSLFIGWFNPEYRDFIIGGAANFVLLTTLALQFHNPERKVAGGQMLIIISLTNLIITLIDGTFTPVFLVLYVIIGLIALLHPGRQDIFRFGRPGNPELLVLLGLAAVPFLIFIVHQMNLQFINGQGLYSAHANITVNLLLFGFLASFKTPGWPIPAWSAGFLAVVHGLTSLVYPDLISSVGSIWGTLAIVWGLAFIGTAEWKRRRAAQA